MPTTFNALYLGNFASIDTYEGNHTAENAHSLVGESFGDASSPLADSMVQLAQVGSPGGYYNMDNEKANETFSIDNGSAQTFDGVAVYNATITYFDGTTANITAVVFQDVNGETYLAPEAFSNEDQDALEAGPIQNLSLNSLSGKDWSGMYTSRETWEMVPCFVAGTLITTATGNRPVEDLKPGDMILTMDHGFQPLRWIGGRSVKAAGALAPVRFAPGAMGNEGALFVSPQHRMLVSGWRVELNFGDEEVLVPAHSLVNGDTIVQVPGGEVTYMHLLFDQHEIVYGAGIPSESFMPGEQGMSSMEQAVQDEIYALFPELRTEGFDAYGVDARPSIKPREARVLIH